MWGIGLVGLAVIKIVFFTVADGLEILVIRAFMLYSDMFP